MKIAIVGTGAMGSVYAGLFAEAGHEVWAVDPWTAHIRAIGDGGLKITGASGDRTITSIRATTDIADAGACELYVVATKASGTDNAARAIATVRGDGLVLTIQNGLGAPERIAAHIPAENVLLGIAGGFGASVVAPGHVHHHEMKSILIGEIEGGPVSRAERLAELWRSAGFEAHACKDIQGPLWEKFLCNVTFSAPCTVFDCTLGELMAGPGNWALALTAMKEAHAIASAMNIPLSFEDPVAHVTAFGAAMPDARPSMLLDHMAGRRSELDAINGRVPPMGRNLGIATPYNDALVAIVQRRELLFEPRATR